MQKSLRVSPCTEAVQRAGTSGQESRKVVFLLAHLHKGGMQRAVSNITQSLPERFDVLTAFFGTEHPDYEFQGGLCDLGLPGEARSSAWRRVKRVIARIRAVRRLVKLREPHVLVSFGEGAALYNLLSGAPRQVLAVRVSLRESLRDTKPLYRYMTEVLVRFAYKHASVIVCNSEQLRYEVAQWCGIVDESRIRVIPNLFNLQEIEQKSKERLPLLLESVYEHPVLLNVGSLIRQKGQRHLVSAFARVLTEFPEARLVLVGRGDDERHLRAQCESLNIAGQVCFAGHQVNPFAFMSRCRVFVLSSLYEGLPNVLIEAMACGVPVVSTDCPTGPREVLSPGSPLNSPLTDSIEEAPHGILVPSCHADSGADENKRESLLAEAICRYLRDSVLSSRLAASSQARAADYSAAGIASVWADLLESEGGC